MNHPEDCYCVSCLRTRRTEREQQEQDEQLLQLVQRQSVTLADLYRRGRQQGLLRGSRGY